MADAQALGTQAAQQLAERFRSGAYPPKHWGYYPNRPFRETTTATHKSTLPRDLLTSNTKVAPVRILNLRLSLSLRPLPFPQQQLHN